MAEPTEIHDQWWAIHGDDIKRMLIRVWNGEDPDVVYAECYAEATRQAVVNDISELSKRLYEQPLRDVEDSDG
jgi:hypothetical protein